MQSHAFSQLGLAEVLTRAVAAEGYTTPTDIQAQAIPMLLSGSNVLGTAQTGTGKTAAFTLPLLHRLIEDGSASPRVGMTPAGTDRGRQNASRSNHRSRRSISPARPLALVLAPTRELAIQIEVSVRTYGGHSGITSIAVFGGAPKPRQVQGLRRNPTVLVATPGRLQDFIGEGEIDLQDVSYLILDEADRMLDMGFIPEVRKIAKMVVNRKQTALFSATMPGEIESLARELLGPGAERVAIAPKTVTADGIKQSVLHIAREDKIGLLPELIRERNMFRVLVFTRTKHRAARVAKVLSKAGIPSDEIHGNRTQNQRQRALESFRNGKVQVLVGTDVAARGIDVDDITHVINYEIPNEPETYVHRIGRTARAGTRGEAISMCDRDELNDFRRIEGLLKRSVEVDRTHRAHLEPPAPATRRDGNRPQGQRGGRPGSGKVTRFGAGRSGPGGSGSGRPESDRRTSGRSGSGRSDSGRSDSGRSGSTYPASARTASGRSQRRATGADRPGRRS
ncbi:MAG: DEAD/DEAH box helicase [Alkalispirochaeta sp.]